MKTVVAGAVGANCGEADLTRCAPCCGDSNPDLHGSPLWPSLSSPFGVQGCWHLIFPPYDRGGGGVPGKGFASVTSPPTPAAHCEVACGGCHSFTYAILFVRDVDEDEGLGLIIMSTVSILISALAGADG